LLSFTFESETQTKHWPADLELLHETIVAQVEVDVAIADFKIQGPGTVADTPEEWVAVVGSTGAEVQ